ncbi:hypothetical protein JCM8097_002706 [Rhodosporidiobolus ruineniae]
MKPWTASPSRPAPPVTSGAPSTSSATTSQSSAAFDSLFAGPSPSSSASAPSPHRTLTSSNSAYSLLSRKMAQIEEQDAAAADDDDRLSIRSGRSTFSRFRGRPSGSQSGEGSGDSTAKGRSRAPSAASSVLTARGFSGSGVDEDGDVQMGGISPGGEGTAQDKGKGKELAEPAPASPSSAKRARLRPPTSDTASIRSSSRRSSWLAPPPSLATNPGSTTAGQPTLSTTTADDLMPSSMMRSKPSRAGSIASSRSTARAATASRPPLPQATGSAATVKPTASPARSISASSARPSLLKPNPPAPSSTSTSTASLSASPTELHLPAPVAQPSTSSSSGRGWFGRGGPAAPSSASTSSATDPSSSSSEGARISSSDPPRPSTSTPPSPAIHPIPEEPFPPASPSTSTSATANPAASIGSTRGWLSLLSRSKPSNLDLAAEAAAQSVTGEGMDVDEPVAGAGGGREGAEEGGEGEATQPATPRAAKRDEAPPPPSDEYDDTTLTRQTALRPSRSSWFTWGRGSSTEVVPGASFSPLEHSAPPASKDSDELVLAQPEQAEQPQPDLESALTPQPPQPADESGGWLSLRSLWGVASGATGGQAAGQLAEQRRREAWALKLAAKGQQQRTIEAVPEDAPLAIEAPPASSTIAEQEVGEGEIKPTQPQELRHKPSSSWSLFSRTPASASSPIAKSTLSLRAPLSGLGLGVASSAASTRSRTSSRADTTAPPSPLLRPQSDQGPVKPLTGSIRASTSPRQRSTSAFDPTQPPVVEENLVLPSFNDTFLRPPRSFEPPKSTLTKAVSAVSAYLFHRPPDEVVSPSLLQQAQQAAGVKTEGMMRSMEGDPAESLPKALEAVGESPRRDRIKRVVCIGVHGWFTSNNMIKSVMGEQTGTSVKFATMMHDAVQSYLEHHETSSFNIQAIALEGQGEVQDRVDKLYNQLLGRDEWRQAVTRADAVFVATHSQGSVVSTQLLARMLDQGLVHGTQTHLLAMCGIAQGPFIYLYQSLALAPYFNYLESAPARELFEFQNPESTAAIKFTESLRIILNAGVKMTVVGSLNDQVVPLYSALFSGVSHPGILRAVYIDSDAFRASDFLANLMVFSARLRNAGLSDHDLCYHVSEALAGALTGVGHSKIYEEPDVFNLAVRYHFETTTLTEAPTHLDTLAPPPPLAMSFNPRDRRNPYLATWALRGIIEDKQVQELFGNELAALQEAYETWKPQTKVLKDVKLKLEGIRLIGRKTGKL